MKKVCNLIVEDGKFLNEFILNQISLLHIKNLPHSKYTLLGIDAVKVFYTNLLKSKDVDLIYLKDKNNLIKGFIFSSSISTKITKKVLYDILKLNFFELSVILLRFLFFVVPKINLIGIFFKKNQFNEKIDLSLKRTAKIISIVIDKKNQGKGLGATLLNKLEELSLKKGYNYLIAETTSLQRNAIKFYESFDNFILLSKEDSKIFNFTYYTFIKKINEIS